MKATSKNGDEWTEEEANEKGWWMYCDAAGNLYESREVPAYRIAMNNAIFTPGEGIAPRNPK